MPHSVLFTQLDLVENCVKNILKIRKLKGKFMKNLAPLKQKYFHYPVLQIKIILKIFKRLIKMLKRNITMLKHS